MAVFDQSFNAEGPTVVAFETVGLTPADVPAFGVAVYSHQCGVNGVALNDVPPNIHRNAPQLVGVHGLGDNEGVQGEGPIGVHGLVRIPGAIGGQGTGVLGEGGRFGVQGTGDVGVRGDGPQAGVEGSGGTGVAGFGDVGVRGNGESAGLVGASRGSRGGVFLTGPGDLPPLDRANAEYAAQLLLVPIEVDGPVVSALPRAAQAGDLLALRSRTERTAPLELWFCRHGGSSDSTQPGAAWARIAFDSIVVVQ